MAETGASHPSCLVRGVVLAQGRETHVVPPLQMAKDGAECMVAPRGAARISQGLILAFDRELETPAKCGVDGVIFFVTGDQAVIAEIEFALVKHGDLEA